MTRISLIHVGLAGVLAASCGRNDVAVLRPPAATSCVPDAYFLSLPNEGGFVLNSQKRDSAGLTRWLRDVLPRRTGTGRIVNVQPGVGRSHDLRWLVAAIGDAGAAAFEFDPACRLQIPSASPQG
jgi:hypothetical protein